MCFMDKLMSAYREAEQRVLSGEDVHVSFTENSKTHMYAIGLLPILTCHGRCHESCGKIQNGRYLPDCYACKYVNRFRSSMERLAINTALAIHKPDRYWKEVSAFMNGQRFMRLFDSGDMIISGYFAGLCRALIENPHCHLQGFTKCYEIVNKYIDANGGLPGNLHLLFSGWYENLPDNPHGLPESRVYDDVLPDGWLSCGGDCRNCACVGLGCWKAERGDIVGLKKH